MRTILLICVILLAWCGPAAAEEGSSVRSLQAVEAEETERRTELLSRIVSDSRTTRRIAVAELRGGFAADPKVVEELLAMLAPQAGPRPPAEPLSAQARINILFLLDGADDEAWSMETVQQARSLLSSYREAEHFVMGPQERELVASLTARVGDLTLPQLAYGEIQGRVEGKLQFTDVDVFVCDYAAQDAPVVIAARDFATRVAEGEFGRVRLREASLELAKQVGAEREKTTIVVDEGHAEERQAKELVVLLERLSGLPDWTITGNTGSASHWYLSVFVCP